MRASGGGCRDKPGPALSDRCSLGSSLRSDCQRGNQVNKCKNCLPHRINVAWDNTRPALGCVMGLRIAIINVNVFVVEYVLEFEVFSSDVHHSVGRCEVMKKLVV
jgi:hypothetical protein